MQGTKVPGKKFTHRSNDPAAARTEQGCGGQSPSNSIAYEKHTLNRSNSQSVVEWLRLQDQVNSHRYNDDRSDDLSGDVDGRL